MNDAGRDRPGRAGSHDRPDPPAPGGPAGPDAPDEPPPFLGSWRRLYLVVAINLAVLIALFYLFTRAFE